jgi:polyvinyl alcohol dehydrogenase (cytochrome)
MIRSCRTARLPRLIALFAIGALVASAAVFAAAGGNPPWPMGGQNIADTRSNTSNLNPSNVKNLALKWKFTTHGDVSATPAVVDGAVYFPDWGGYLNKVDASTGALIWQRQISEYDGISGAVARTSPAVDGDTVYIGDQNGGHLLAVNATTGALRWSTDISGGSFFAIETQSPIVYNNVVYVGVASSEEGIVAFVPNYPCCHDRGSFSAVNATTGQIIWQIHTTVPGYSGAGVWGSTAALDPSTHTVYISTGNNYSVPQSAKDCEEAGGTPPDCLDPANYVDSILALDSGTGGIKWANKLEPGFDDWNVACIPGFPNSGTGCPENPGPDYDFGSGPNLFTIGNGSKARKVVGAGQKSGDYWLMDAATGEVLWRASPGPGSTLGGIEWGTAVDNKRIYVAETNYGRESFQTASGQTINYGSWAAIDQATGKTVWQTPDPEGGIDLGPTTVANGVVYAGSLTGEMYALDANNGKVLWKYQGDGASNASPAVVGGTVYWGNGYNHLGIPEGSPSNSFYAFSINGH